MTGRSKAYYLRELIEQGIDDLEDAYLGAAVLERIRSGKEQTCSLNDVMTELDLDASDLCCCWKPSTGRNVARPSLPS
jgi:RHH-type rel operon transcriptional repressor/antitoxin RelB